MDALSVMYAGQTQYLDELWPHNAWLQVRRGTMRTGFYMLTSMGRTSADLSIGTFCHENGHMLCRFPDMYDYGSRDTDAVQSAGIGQFCLMGAGNHLDRGRTPSPVCAYLRDLAGWCKEEVELAHPGSYVARHGAYGAVHRYRHPDPGRANEYYLVENRSKMALDAHLPPAGWPSTTATRWAPTSGRRGRPPATTSAPCSRQTGSKTWRRTSTGETGVTSTGRWPG